MADDFLKLQETPIIPLISMDPAKEITINTLQFGESRGLDTYVMWRQSALLKIAKALEVPFEFLRSEIPPPPVTTSKMLRLISSRDRRKRKRAWRLYFERNGKDAPQSMLLLTAKFRNNVHFAKAFEDYKFRKIHRFRDHLEEKVNSNVSLRFPYTR